MLELYFVRPATWDRIRQSWIGTAIETYVRWLTERHYARRTVLHRVPIVEQFGEFARQAGASDWADLPRYVKPFVDRWLEQHGRRCVTERARRTLRHAARIPVEQMLRLVVPGFAGTRRPTMPLPFARQVPGYFDHLRDERGLRPESIRHHIHYARVFETYLARIRLAALTDLTPQVVSNCVTDAAQRLSPLSITSLVWTLRALLRFMHRQGITKDDLSKAVEEPLRYRDAALPRSITWSEVERVLGAIDRRTAVGKRDYAMLLLLVSYGLRASEVAAMRLDDLDWRRGQFRVPQRKADHSAVYPLSDEVGDAIAQYLREARPATNDRHLLLNTRPPFGPMTFNGVSLRAHKHLMAARIAVPRAGSHTLRHTCVQRLVDVGMSLKQIGDFVGHRSTESTRIYGKLSIETLREVALGDGESVL